MKESKPVIELEMLVKWCRCPMKVFWTRVKSSRIFDYESLLRTMVLNTLKAGYREVKPGDQPDLEHHISDIWEYLLRARSFPNPGYQVKKMYEFFEIRSRYLDQLEKRYQDSTGLLNLNHWWDSGLIFDLDYFRLRDEINKFQSLLGFPNWNDVKTYYRDAEYYPVSLADTFCDYMNGIRIFSFRKIPSVDIQFDVPAYIDLVDIRMTVRFDILWRRSKVYKSKSQNLNPGLVAEQLIPLSLFANAEQLRRECMIFEDIRMPLIGIDYVKENGEKFQIDSLSCCTYPANTGTSAWKESYLEYDPETAESFLSRLNHYGLEYLSAVKQNLFIPCGLVKNDICASCSFLSDCWNRDNEKDRQTAMEEKDAGILSSFFETFEERAALCGDKAKVMDLMIETLKFLNENPSLRMINKLSNAAVNLKHDLSGGKDAAS